MGTHALNYEPYPSVQPTGAPADDYQRISVNPEMFGGAVARGEQALGQGIEKATDTVTNIEVARATLNNEVHANEKLTWLANEGTQRLEKFKQLEGKAAAMQLPQFQSGLLDLHQQTLDGENPSVRAHLSRGATALIDRYQSYAASHAATQERTWHDKTAIDQAMTFGNQAVLASLNGTWDDVEAFLSKSDHGIQALFEQRLYDRPAIDAEVAKNRGKNVLAMIKTLEASGDPRTAESVFEQHKNGMDAASVVAAAGAIKTMKAQADGRIIADEASGRAPPGGAVKQPVADVPASFIGAIKQSEGFTSKAQWDYKQHSIGYGTKAAGPGEVITREEADRRFETEIAAAAKFVDGVNPKLDPGSRAALTSLTFNAGTGWATQGLGDAVRTGDVSAMRERFIQYNRAGGEVNPGLVSRRAREISWFGQNEAPASNAPTIDRTQAYEGVLARTDGNPLLQNAAIARLNQIYSLYHTEQVAQKAAFVGEVRDHVAQVWDGKPLAEPKTEADFVLKMGPEQGPEAYRQYRAEIDDATDAHALGGMPAQERLDVLEKRQPQADTKNYAENIKRRDRMEKLVRDSDKGFADRVRNDVAQAWDGKPVEVPLTEADFVVKFGKEAASDKYRGYLQELNDAQEGHKVAAMSPQEIEALRTGIDESGAGPDEAIKRRDRLMGIANKLETERLKDPAAYAEKYLPAVKAALATLTATLSDPKIPMEGKRAAAEQYAEIMFAEQARVAGGVGTVDTRTLLSKPRIEEMKAALLAPDAAGGPGPVAERIRQLADLWGVDNYARIYRQFGKDAGGLIEVLGSGVKPEAARLLVQFSPLSAATLLKDESKDKFSLIADEVRTAIQPFARSLPGEHRDVTIHNFEGQMQKLAAHYYVTEGSGGTGDARKAATRAFNEVVGSKYEFRGTYRIPKDLPQKPDDIALGADWAKRHLAELGIAPAIGDRALTVGGAIREVGDAMRHPDGVIRAYDYLTRARATDMGRDGVWATAPHEEGLILMNPRTEAAVTLAPEKEGAERKPLIIPWAKLAEYSQQAIKERAISPGHKTFKERNADLYWPQGERYQTGGEPGESEPFNPITAIQGIGAATRGAVKSAADLARENYK